VVIRHVGYQDPALRARKLQRDLRLLEMEQREQPDDAFTLFNLGSVYREQGKLAGATLLFQKSLELSAPADSIVRKLYVLLAQCQRQLGRLDQAQATIARGRKHFPDDVELLFQQGVALKEAKDLPGARASWLAVRAAPAPQHFASVDVGLRGHLVLHNLALTCAELGLHDEAEEHWRAALADQPDYVPALFGVAEACLRRGQWQELEGLLQKLESVPAARDDAVVLRARAHLARREFTETLALLDAAIAARPRALWPRVIRSHALLQQGQDWDAAEQALRDVLALDPGHEESRQNLKLLLKQQGKPLDDFLTDESTLAKLYRADCHAPSDINEHLPVLYALARQCRNVTELGTRTGTSTTAFLYARPERLVCCAPVQYPQLERLGALAGSTAFVFHEQDPLHADLEETDLLFVYGCHTRDQLQALLARHGAKARTCVVLHGTTTFAERGEDGGPGLWPAVEEFLAQGTFRLRERLHHNNGLTILERI
jgi:tetratricopeptide (TPR) repeat protein